MLRMIAEDRGGLSDSTTILMLIYEEAVRRGLRSRGAQREQEEISEQAADSLAR